MSETPNSSTLRSKTPDNIGSFPLRVNRPADAPADWQPPATIWVNLIRFESGRPKIQITISPQSPLALGDYVHSDLDSDDLDRLQGLFDARREILKDRMFTKGASQ